MTDLEIIKKGLEHVAQSDDPEEKRRAAVLAALCTKLLGNINSPRLDVLAGIDKYGEVIPYV